MQVKITLDGGIARYAHRLSTLADQLPQIEREGLQEGGKLTLTRIRRTLRSQMNTKRQGPINAGTSGVLVSNDTFVIRGTGKGLPIEEFPVKGGRKRANSWRDQPRDGAGRFGPLPDSGGGLVISKPWGVTHRFKRSFVSSSGKYVARIPGTRQLRRLYGPGVAKEIVKDESAAVFQAEGPANVEKCIVRRIGRLI